MGHFLPTFSYSYCKSNPFCCIHCLIQAKNANPVIYYHKQYGLNRNFGNFLRIFYFFVENVILLLQLLGIIHLDFSFPTYIKSMASRTLFTPITFIPFISFTPSIHTAGMIQVVNPSFLASCTRPCT